MKFQLNSPNGVDLVKNSFELISILLQQKKKSEMPGMRFLILESLQKMTLGVPPRRKKYKTSNKECTYTEK